MKKKKTELEALSIRIPKNLKMELKVHCAKKSLVMQKFVEDAIWEKLRREKK